MPERLRYLPLFELEAGMMLGRPVSLSERGHAVYKLPAGHVLSEANLSQLRAHHAEFACVVEQDEREESLRCQERAAQEARLAVIFRNADLSHPQTRAFYEAVLAYRSA